MLRRLRFHLCLSLFNSSIISRDLLFVAQTTSMFLLSVVRSSRRSAFAWRLFRSFIFWTICDSLSFVHVHVNNSSIFRVVLSIICVTTNLSESEKDQRRDGKKDWKIDSSFDIEIVSTFLLIAFIYQIHFVYLVLSSNSSNNFVCFSMARANEREKEKNKAKISVFIYVSCRHFTCWVDRWAWHGAKNWLPLLSNKC